MSALNTPSAGPATPPGRGFWPMRDLPTAIWLVLTVLAALLHQYVPAPRWLIIHLLLLGAVTHAILVWSQHFSYALLRSRASYEDRRAQNIRLVLANAGAALVFIAVPTRVWALTLVGAVTLIVAVVWHGISILRRSRKSLPGKFGRTIRYYIAAAAALAIGAGLGAWIASGTGSRGLVLAHALINVLGWIGLTVAGTVVTLWPTMLRTRADAQAPVGAARALPLLAAGALAAAGGAAIGWLLLIIAGLAAYLAGLAIIGASLWRSARTVAPRSFATLSVGTALLWWAAAIAVLLIGSIAAFVRGDDLRGVAALTGQIVPFLAAGFAAQVLIGALSYLVPVVLGGGPSAVKVGARAFDRFGRLRVCVSNGALIVCALPAPEALRLAAAACYLLAMASFLVIMMAAMRAQRKAKLAASGSPSAP